jgi:hypothetical protein
VVASSRLNKVLIDDGSGLNVLFTKTLKKMKLDITHMLTKSTSPFYDIVPSNAAIPLGSVVLPVTFGESRDNYRTEYVKFEVADFETSYHAILGKLAIAKFMAVPHYTYLVLKMPSPAGVLSLQGDLKISHNCDMEAVEIASTNQVPNAMMEVFVASKKLAPSELAKLLAAGFIREVFHPEWLTNPVLVRKKNSNKHCPKDNFGLPRIDQVIDSTAGCDLLCFLDCYSGYHQIAIKEEDQEKTAFITPFGAYCYTTMSFGLKNAGATYQRVIQAC